MSPTVAADFDDDDVRPEGRLSTDSFLDLVGDVGNHLNGLAQVVAAALLRDHVGVDGSRRRIGNLRQGLVDKALVVTEVEVGLSAVVGDEDLTVLARVHRARIDIEVGIELAHRDAQASGLEQSTER